MFSKSPRRERESRKSSSYPPWGLADHSMRRTEQKLVLPLWRSKVSTSLMVEKMEKRCASVCHCRYAVIDSSLAVLYLSESSAKI